MLTRQSGSGVTHTGSQYRAVTPGRSQSVTVVTSHTAQWFTQTVDNMSARLLASSFWFLLGASGTACLLTWSVRTQSPVSPPVPSTPSVLTCTLHPQCPHLYQWPTLLPPSHPARPSDSDKSFLLGSVLGVIVCLYSCLLPFSPLATVSCVALSLTRDFCKSRERFVHYDL